MAPLSASFFFRKAFIKPFLTLKIKLDSKESKEVPRSKSRKNQSGDLEKEGEHSDKISFICKFSNEHNNCWMNSAFQSILHMNIIRKKMSEMAFEDIQTSSPFPACSKMFLKALHRPGQFFSSTEVFHVLKELSKAVPTLVLSGQNDISQFLEPLMQWLNDCGVKSTVQIQHTKSCKCPVSASEVSNLGNILYLSYPGKNDCVGTLFDRAIKKVKCKKQCDTCLRKVRKNIFFSTSDLFTFYVPRPHKRLEDRRPLRLIDFLYVPVNGGRETYHLSSVICHKILNSDSGHFYTYIVSEGVIIKANDSRISLAEKDSEEDITKNGLIFFYERFTEQSA